jgi:hypothetical protein
MVHQGQSLSFSLEAGQYLAGVHPQFDDFQGYAPSNGLSLLGEVNHAKPAFTKCFKDAVVADVLWSIAINRPGTGGRFFEKRRDVVGMPDEREQFFSQDIVITTSSSYELNTIRFRERHGLIEE